MSAEDLLGSDFASLPDLVRAHAAERPDHPALIEGDETLTYGGLVALMDRIAFALQRDSVKSGDAVAVCARTSIAYAAAFCGILAAGAAVAPLAPSSSPASLASMLRDSGARLLLLDSETAATLQGSGYETFVRPVALDDGGAGEPFSRWLGPEGAKPAPVSIAPGQPFNIIYSSGTTGEPKGHRPAACDAVGPVQAGFLQRGGHDRLDAALFEHHPRRLRSDAGAWRDGRAPRQIRRRRVPPPV